MDEIRQSQSTEEPTVSEEVIEEPEEKGFWDKLVNKIESSVNEAIDKAENTLNKLVNEIAALIVTSIVIPILVFLLFIWIINTWKIIILFFGIL